jgi:hypothetical protein
VQQNLIENGQLADFGDDEQIYDIATLKRRQQIFDKINKRRKV